MYGKRKAPAGEARSAVAVDRVGGAGTGRLFRRLLSPTAISVPRAPWLLFSGGASVGEVGIRDMAVCARLG